MGELQRQMAVFRQQLMRVKQDDEANTDIEQELADDFQHDLAMADDLDRVDGFQHDLAMADDLNRASLPDLLMEASVLHDFECAGHLKEHAAKENTSDGKTVQYEFKPGSLHFPAIKQSSMCAPVARQSLPNLAHETFQTDHVSGERFNMIDTTNGKLPPKNRASDGSWTDCAQLYVNGRMNDNADQELDTSSAVRPPRSPLPCPSVLLSSCSSPIQEDCFV